MDLHPTLEALGVDSLADITLEELQNKVNNVQYGIVPRYQVLQVFMGWLHEQITRDIQQTSLLSAFVDLLLAPAKLHQGPFTEGEVDAAFKEWQANDAAENPANIRRYQMVHLDFLKLFEQARRGSNSEPDWSFGPSGFDREQDSSDEAIGTRLVGGGKRKSGSNEVPLGKRRCFRNNTHQSTAKIKEEDNGESYFAKAKSENSLLRPYSNVKSAGQDVSPKKHSSSSLPPPTYICNRCYQPGHWIQLCPTNMDPEWDRPPPVDYTCEICMKKGHHFATLCPKNNKQSSLTKKRLRQEEPSQARLKTPTRDSKTRGQDRHRLTPPSRRRSRTPKNNHHQVPDIYRLDDDKSQVQVNDYEKSRDRSLSPYSVRRLITPSKGYDHERDSNIYPQKPSQAPSRKLPIRRPKVPSPQGHPRSSLDLNKTHKGEMGRLSYDDVFMDFNGTSLSPKEYIFPHRRKVVDTNLKENEVTKHASVDVDDMPKEMEKTKAEINKFLDEVKNELLLAKKPVPSNEARLVPEDVYVKGDEGYSGDKMNTDKGENTKCDSNKSNLASTQTDQHNQGLKSGLQVMSLLKNRENAIVKNKVNRKTAVEMFDELNLFPTKP
ncbi:uncharacterized protein GGS22DRAFT_196790 [Annulohypoxylon maeteangense]|uniref:uncharacterized protein n=1 Tax=Annulohypoxylon maeteangense TaxID=1927788 RepID=UPI002008B072|nr:uncharacterized protein GGS22DRAFT_196790 [Annulohypoxylon maeteangense]KAI0889114.1 hypothetical protein GGS22DRAFT_196790 [Annulohypoxylon maeteangense]